MLAASPPSVLWLPHSFSKWQVKWQIWQTKPQKGDLASLWREPWFSFLPKGVTIMSMEHANSSASRRDVNRGAGEWSFQCGDNWELCQTKFDWKKLSFYRLSRFDGVPPHRVWISIAPFKNSREHFFPHFAVFLLVWKQSFQDHGMVRKADHSSNWKQRHLKSFLKQRAVSPQKVKTTEVCRLQERSLVYQIQLKSPIRNSWTTVAKVTRSIKYCLIQQDIVKCMIEGRQEKLSATAMSRSKVLLNCTEVSVLGVIWEESFLKWENLVGRVSNQMVSQGFRWTTFLAATNFKCCFMTWSTLSRRKNEIKLHVALMIRNSRLTRLT